MYSHISQPQFEQAQDTLGLVVFSTAQGLGD
jgi:hypothetical protein